MQRGGDQPVAHVEVAVPLVPVLPPEVGVPHAGPGQRHGREAVGAGAVAELDVVPLEEQRQRVADRAHDRGRDQAGPPAVVLGVDALVLHRRQVAVVVPELPTVQDQRIDTEYNGWWACLIPAAVVRAIGYPLPLFFQWDDVEFGYRARAHGFPTVTLPGAGVWHADFGWKDWDEWHRYFNMRNALITAALHTAVLRARGSAGRLGTLLGQYLVAMQYGLAATLIQAVDDFLDGPEVLRDGSAAAAAEIRRIRAAYPETQMRPVADGRPVTSARCRSSAPPTSRDTRC